MGASLHRTLLKAPVRMEDGRIVPRMAGTPQGGVVSPCLANLFLHYVFDMWMVREFPDIPSRGTRTISSATAEAPKRRGTMERFGGPLRGLQAGAAPAEDKARLLQGCKPEGRLSDPVV